MSNTYNYETEKASIFTEEGQVMFLKVRDFVQWAIKECGAVSMGSAIRAAGSGSMRQMMACVDRLVELGELREVSAPYTWGQYRVFVGKDYQ